jgi:hypothetical protein
LIFVVTWFVFAKHRHDVAACHEKARRGNMMQRMTFCDRGKYLKEPIMIPMKLLTAVILSMAVATPVMAKDAMHSQSNKMTKHQRVHHAKTHARHHAQLRLVERDAWARRDSGFWPGQVAAGVAAGAIGTAAAIASTPFGGGYYAANDPYNSYAYDSGYYGGGYYGEGYLAAGRYNQTYMQRNGLACLPGTTFKGSDGLMHICQ